MTKPILFYSTNDPAKVQPGMDFADALMKGLAPDKGLYLMSPDDLPQFSSTQLADFAELPYHEVAFRVLWPFLNGRIPEKTFRDICADAYNFPVPLENYAPGHSILRLDQGPTNSFKDFAARMMGRLMRYFLAERGEEIVILTATSGDTGGAVASAFYGLDKVRVVVLFPDGEVSERQRRQMTTLGGNVHAVCVTGKFDDCQDLVKQAFVDPELRDLPLSSANSINVGRLLPQSVYYIYSAMRANRTGKPLAVCVPSGNFGNVMAGLLAKLMGLPVDKFVIAVNENDEFPVYLRTDAYKPISPSRACLSNAMNVGHPSNLARLVTFYGGVMDEKGNITCSPDKTAIMRDMMSIEVSDDATREAILRAYQSDGVVLEPHGAVGWSALDTLGVKSDYDTILLETAHPAKFPESVIEAIGIDPELPESMKHQQDSKELSHACSADYSDFKRLLRRLL